MNVVILSVSNWLGISRLPQDLTRVGFAVTAIALENTYITYTEFLEGCVTFPLMTTRPKLLELIEQTVEEVQPDIIIPGDDTAFDVLMRQYLAGVEAGTESRLQSLLARSLPSRQTGEAFLSRSGMVSLAIGSGVFTPRAARIRTYEELETYVRSLASNPELKGVVLKTEGGFAGQGVVICLRGRSVREAFELIQTVDPKLQKFGGQIVVQEFIPGHCIVGAFVALDGVVLQSTAAHVVRTHPGATGASSVIRYLDSPTVAAIISQFVAYTGYNGFGSLDIIVDSEQKRPYVIECNPRPIPSNHLGRFVGRDLSAALMTGLGGTPDPEGIGRVDNGPAFGDAIALFPQEWLRDRNSEFIQGFNDAPLDDPELLQHMIDSLGIEP